MHPTVAISICLWIRTGQICYLPWVFSLCLFPKLYDVFTSQSTVDFLCVISLLTCVNYSIFWRQGPCTILPTTISTSTLLNITENSLKPEKTYWLCWSWLCLSCSKDNILNLSEQFLTYDIKTTYQANYLSCKIGRKNKCRNTGLWKTLLVFLWNIVPSMISKLQKQLYYSHVCGCMPHPQTNHFKDRWWDIPMGAVSVA